MNAKEALESIKGIDIIVEHCAYHYTDTDYKEAFECIESALTELEEIKKRAEEKRGMFQKGIETSKGTPAEPFVEVSNTHKIRLIDFIIKGEGK